jgi:hypothetical protein
MAETSWEAMIGLEAYLSKAGACVVTGFQGARSVDEDQRQPKFNPEESITSRKLLFPSGEIVINRHHSKDASSIVVRHASDAACCENIENIELIG